MWFIKKLPTKIKESKVPDGLWMKCDNCKELLYKKEVAKNLWICSNCGFHFRIPARKYIEILMDEFKELYKNLTSTDPLNFPDYQLKIENIQKKTNLKEAIIVGEGYLNQFKIALGVMDFNFMGGSMGSVVGEKVKRITDLARENKIPLIIISSSGGARMQEGILSLMQMAKTASAIYRLKKEKGLYISVLTNPTTAGVMASFASLGDIVLAEPGALIGFAGPRVIKQTIKEELPEGFQRAEFLIKKGMLDAVVERKKLKETLTKLINFFN
jgi:acetyl-CoA carboxylase carboxyl transferase subunit beta